MWMGEGFAMPAILYVRVRRQQAQQVQDWRQAAACRCVRRTL